MINAFLANLSPAPTPAWKVYMYTPLEEAKEEVWQRWHNPALRQKALEFAGGGGFLKD